MPTLHQVLSWKEKFLMYCLMILPALGFYGTYQSQFQNRSDQELAVTLLALSVIPFLAFVILADRKKRRQGRKKRRAFTDDTKQFVLNRQDYSCNICGTSLQMPTIDFDHIGSRNDNSPENCQALCLNCHREKTSREKRNKKNP